MSQLSIRAFVLVGMMLLASATPLAQLSKADPEIELDVDMPHMILTPGESMNLTLTIHNNGSSIETYDVEIDSTVSPPFDTFDLELNRLPLKRVSLFKSIPLSPLV